MYQSIGFNHIQKENLRHENCSVKRGEACMIRGLLKLVLVVIVVVGVGAFLAGIWSTNAKVVPNSPISSSGPVDTSKAREAGARIAEGAAKAANEAEEAIEHGTITAKIKAKMVVDDFVKARNIHVETNGTVVTLTGVVDSEAERKHAVALAKETDGVTSVVDHLQVR
jgi:hyperosmotically inducible protein